MQLTHVFTLLFTLVARCYVTFGAETAQELLKARFIQNSSWRDEDGSSHLQLHLTHENEVRGMWGTCGSSSWCKAERAAILAIGGQMIRAVPFWKQKIRVAHSKEQGFPGREPADLQVP